MPADNFSHDLLWEIVNGHNSFLVKRKQSGGVSLSRDPLNLTNKHARKYEGFANDKAIGIQPAAGGKGGLVLTTKRPGKESTPAQRFATSSFAAHTGPRKTYRAIVNSTAKRGYRSDLRAEAVSRASAIKSAQRKKKDTVEPKLRGAKARRAAAASA